jgi:hypothetical protein
VNAVRIARYAVIALFFLAFASFRAPSQTVAPDPRIAGPMIQALQAQVALQQAMMKAQAEDAEAQKKTLWDWLLSAQAEAKK